MLVEPRSTCGTGRPVASRTMSAARLVIDANIRLSKATAGILQLPSDKDLWGRFEQEVQHRIRSLPDGASVLDVGGGRRCVYWHALRPELELIVADVSAEELALNPHATHTVVADVSQGLPLPAASVDLLVSRAVLEHVPDVRAAARNMASVLKPGATTIHLVPGRFSLFGLAARVLPFKALLAAVHRVLPHTADQVEFEVHYDQGTPAQMQRAFEAAGFRDVSVEVTWAQPGYFEAVYPLFLLYTAYEAIVRRLRVRPLAAYMVVQATR